MQTSEPTCPRADSQVAAATAEPWALYILGEGKIGMLHVDVFHPPRYQQDPVYFFVSIEPAMARKYHHAHVGQLSPRKAECCTFRDTDFATTSPLPTSYPYLPRRSNGSAIRRLFYLANSDIDLAPQLDLISQLAMRAFWCRDQRPAAVAGPEQNLN